MAGVAAAAVLRDISCQCAAPDETEIYERKSAAAYILTAAAASFELLVLLGLSDGETLLLSVWSFDTAAGYLFCAFSGIAVSTVAVTVLGQPKKDTFKTNKSGGGV